MTVTSIGDLSYGFQLRNRSAEVKAELSRLTDEMSSGRFADLGRALDGDFSGLAAVERGQRLTSAYIQATEEAALHTGAMQNVLETVQTQLSTLAPVLLTATGAGQFSALAVAAADAGEVLEMVVGGLNGSIAGRSPFAGQATDRPALIGGADMLAELRPLVAGLSDPAAMVATLEDWFLAPGGGYETVAYQGSTEPFPGFSVAEGERVSPGISALDPEIREALLAIAMTALVGEGLGPASEPDRRALLEDAGTRMLTGQDGLARLRGDLGGAEGRIEQTRQRNTAAEAVLSMEHARLVSVDPYQTATELEAVQTQLETIYLITARLSRLSLAEYLG